MSFVVAYCQWRCSPLVVSLLSFIVIILPELVEGKYLSLKCDRLL